MPKTTARNLMRPAIFHKLRSCADSPLQLRPGSQRRTLNPGREPSLPHARDLANILADSVRTPAKGTDDLRTLLHGIAHGVRGHLSATIVSFLSV